MLVKKKQSKWNKMYKVITLIPVTPFIHDHDVGRVSYWPVALKVN